MIFTGGQRRIFEEGEQAPVYPRAPYLKIEKVKNIAPLEIHPKFASYDYVVDVDDTEFIPGVTAEMIDWWWANMEKGYLIWAPGEHYGFEWIKPPCEYGYEGSVEASYEFQPVHPILITRIGMQHYPFTECYEHCWLAEGDLGPIHTRFIHMYQDVPGGILWRTVRFLTREMSELFENIRDQVPDTTSHTEYESGRLSLVVPPLYELWKDHPDPFQNVHYDLTTRKKEDGTWEHVCKNLPPQK